MSCCDLCCGPSDLLGFRGFPPISTACLQHVPSQNLFEVSCFNDSLHLLHILVKSLKLQNARAVECIILILQVIHWETRIVPSGFVNGMVGMIMGAFESLICDERSQIDYQS